VHRGRDWQELHRNNGGGAILPWNVPDDNTHPPRPDTTSLFAALQNAKFDPHFWKSLSVRDALRALANGLRDQRDREER